MKCTSSFLRSTLNLRLSSPSSLPPTFLLPWRAQLHQSTHPTTSQPSPPDPFSHPKPAHPPHRKPSTPIPTAAPSPSTPLTLTPSLRTLLPLLTAQKPHYITAHIHRLPYLLTAGDTLRLPFHMHGVSPGDILRLNRASLLGSRDYTLKAGTQFTESYDGKRLGTPNYIDERLFECRVRVMGTDTGPMVMMEKTKRRCRKVKTVKSKHRYTVLRVMEVRVKGLEEVKGSEEAKALGDGVGE